MDGKHVLRWGAALAALLLVAHLGAQPPVESGQNAVGRVESGLLESQLSRGEFAPYRASVAELAPAERDSRLADLALAQQRAGAIPAGVQTLFLIADSEERQRAVLPLGELWGGGAEPDFQGLMDLISSTVSRNSWAANGGAGEMRPFEGGVRVDAQGTLARLPDAGFSADLAIARYEALHATTNRDVRRRSLDRKVSLTRLERALQQAAVARHEPDESMLALAGLERIRAVYLYPESGEIILAGPAGDWRLDREGRWVSAEQGGPIVRLEDMALFCRLVARGEPIRFGCSITPTQQGLAQTRALAAETSGKPLRPGERDSWAERLRNALGAQGIDVYGLPPSSRGAHILVEADYRMKLVGLGLEPSVLGVPPYFELIELAPGSPPPALDVLRWWFTMNYASVAVSPDRDAFELRGPGVRLMSENERLTAEGERVPTGQAEPWNRQFAANFTQHFAALSAKYPVYGELRNIFDLALVAALLQGERAPEACRARLAGLAAAEGLFPLRPEAKQVDSVVAQRVFNKVHVVVAVSGGVAADPSPWVKTSGQRVDSTGQLARDRTAADPSAISAERWWWD